MFQGHTAQLTGETLSPDERYVASAESSPARQIRWWLSSEESRWAALFFSQYQCWTAVFHLAISNMAQHHVAFCVLMLPFMCAMLPFMCAMLPFRGAMLPFYYSDSEVPHWTIATSYLLHPSHCHSGKHLDHWCLALTPMTQYLITACVHSGNNWRCLHT